MSTQDRIASDNDDEDGRDTARIWLSFIYVALHHGIKTDHRGADMDLAFMIHEANAMRIVAQAACESAGLDFDELLGSVRHALAQRTTKVARTYFEKERRRWADSFKAELGASAGKSE
jgi:hypothetical protein